MKAASQAETQTPDGHAYTPVSWLPLPLLCALAVWFGRSLAPWAYLCALALAIYFSLKWLTWWRERGDVTHTAARSAAYLLAWPGMDAATFLGDSRARKPQYVQWGWALTKTCMGILLMWVCARHVPATLPLLQGWIGLLALILLLHFGSFELIALGWQSVGVNAQAIMQQPLSSYSRSEFWGKRWNLGFRQLSHEFIFQPSHRVIGTQWAMLLVFLVSGLIHESVISLPARGGYGLPTAYFVLQGVGVLVERSPIGRLLRLQGGLSGWAFMAVVIVAPVFWLFHVSGKWNWITPCTAVCRKVSVSNVLLRRITSERRVIQPELSGLCRSAELSARLLFVYLLGVSVPNAQRAFCGV